LKKNIFCLYIIKMAKWFNLVMPIIVLFYQSAGMGMQDIFLLKSVYSIAIVALEIPSGYMADQWGRKKTLFLGSIFGALGFLIYSFNEAFLGFMVAEIILGVGQSFISGADTAMLYDTLKAEKKEYRYLKAEGRLTAGGNFGEALAGITGGFLATFSLHMPFYCQTIVAAAAIPAAICLTEPTAREKRSRKTLAGVLQVVRMGFMESGPLRGVLLLSSLTGTATLTFAWFVQPYFKVAGLPLAYYGVFWTLLNLTTGISGLFAHRIEKRMGERISPILIVCLITLGYLLAGSTTTLAGIGFLFFFYVVRGLATPIFKDYVNRHTDSEIRATLFSVRNFMIRISFAVVGPVLGWVTDRVGLGKALWLGGGLYIVLCGGYLLLPLVKSVLSDSSSTPEA